MNACESVAPAIIESRDPQELGSLLDDPETGSQRLKPDCGAEVYRNTDVVPSQAVPERKPRWFPAIWRELGKTRATRKTPHIVHVKVHELFASVEQALNPRLRGKPVLVGRGVVASASCEAKILGVKTGMNLIEARRICPKAILVSGQYKHYADIAERVRRILETYTPTVETAALDDFYLDFAGSQQLYGDFEVTLRRLQAEVLGRTGLNVSAGAGGSKVVASIASQLVPAHNLCIVPPGTEEVFLAPLAVEKLYAVGPAHAVSLAEQGVTTIGQLRRIPKPALVAAFGEEIGEQIWERVRGIDGRESPGASASLSRETSIEGGSTDSELLGGLLEYLSERIGAALQEQGKQAGTIGVRVLCVRHSRAQQTVRLARPTNAEHELLMAAKQLFAKAVARGVAVRQVGVSVTNLDAGRRQNENETVNAEVSRRSYANRQVNTARARYGWNAVLQGS
jgi:DNA polymerase-4